MMRIELFVNGVGEVEQGGAVDRPNDGKAKALIDPRECRDVFRRHKLEPCIVALGGADVNRQSLTGLALVHELRRGLGRGGQQPSAHQGIALFGKVGRRQRMSDTA